MVLRQLKGPLAAEESQGQNFRYYSEIYALHLIYPAKKKKKTKLI